MLDAGMFNRNDKKIIDAALALDLELYNVSDDSNNSLNSKEKYNESFAKFDELFEKIYIRKSREEFIKDFSKNLNLLAEVATSENATSENDAEETKAKHTRLVKIFNDSHTICNQKEAKAAKQLADAQEAAAAEEVIAKANGNALNVHDTFDAEEQSKTDVERQSEGGDGTLLSFEETYVNSGGAKEREVGDITGDAVTPVNAQTDSTQVQATTTTNKKTTGQKVAHVVRAVGHVTYEATRLVVMTPLLAAKLVVQIVINIVSFVVNLACAILVGALKVLGSVIHPTTFPKVVFDAIKNDFAKISDLVGTIALEIKDHAHAVVNFKDTRSDFNALTTFNFTNFSEVKSLQATPLTA